MDLSEDTIENCRIAIKAMIQGPRGVLARVLPENTQVRALYMLESGELVVDFSHELRGLKSERKASTSSEGLMAFSVANTLTQPALAGSGDAIVESVRFLMEGSPLPQGPFPGHIDLSEPIRPDARWNKLPEKTAPSDD